MPETGYAWSISHKIRRAAAEISELFQRVNEEIADKTRPISDRKDKEPEENSD